MTHEIKEMVKQDLIEARVQLLETIVGLSAEELETAVYSEETVWTVADLVRHLASAESSMTSLMQRIQAGADGVPPDFDLARWNASRIAKVKDKTPAEIIQSMSQNREQLFAFIDTLQPEDWDKQGRHGSLKIMTIAEICAVIAGHERQHSADIRQALAL